MLNKVPEVTVYFWVIKILCTTVGESFADYINETLGFGLTNTTLVFSAALIATLVVQFRRDRYVPGVYWLAVVLISVVGDWTLELTGWSPGAAVLLPAGLILVVFFAWKLGAGPVLTFWLAYILTRPLGANIGDFLASPTPTVGSVWGPSAPACCSSPPSSPRSSTSR
jgi:uncharacterized membrane-anchored protein